MDKIKASLDPEFFTKSELIQKQSEDQLTSSIGVSAFGMTNPHNAMPSQIHDKEKTTSDLDYLSNLSKTIMESAKTNL